MSTPMIRIEWIRLGDTSGQWRLYEFCEDEAAARKIAASLWELGHQATVTTERETRE